MTDISKSGRKAGQRGNVFVESALVLGPYFMLLFATIDFSIAVFMQITVQDAVREGTRYAITGRTGSNPITGVACSGQDNCIKSVVQYYGMGFISDPTNISINYYDPNNNFVATNSNAAGNVVQVRVSNMSWAWMCPYARNATALQYAASSSDVVEPSPNGVPPAR